MYYLKFSAKIMLLLTFCSAILFSEDDVVVKEMLPNYELRNLDKKKVEILDYLETGPMLISFWFLACEPCKKEMKFLNEFNNKYAEQGFKVISINTDNTRALSAVKPYINSKKYTFEVLSDPRSKYFKKTGGQLCPYTILVDHTGAIFSKHLGFNMGDEEKLEKEVLELIELFEAAENEKPKLVYPPLKSDSK